MKTKLLLFAVFLLVCSIAFSQESDNAKYIEVTGTSEITLVRNLTESPNRRIIGLKCHW